MEIRRTLIALILLGLLLPACGSAVAQAPQSGPDRTPVPYATVTPGPTRDPGLYLPGTPLPTATPVIYIVVTGDTLFGIAGRFGITLEDLLAANPGIGDQALQVGAQIIIPSGSPSLAGQPTPSPVPLTAGEPVCYPTADGGLWCLAPVTHAFSDRIENITAQIDLLGADNLPLAGAAAMLPLDLLPPGESLPLLAFFPAGQAPVAEFHPRVSVLTATRLLPSDTRYLSVELQSVLVQVQAGGLTARVSGTLRLPGATAARQIWVAATAYDLAGRPVGSRRWEAARGLNGGESLAFEFDLYSLGPAIDRVEVVAEARP